MAVNDCGKKFYNIGPRCQFHKHFTSSFFVQKFFYAAFMCLQFGFVIFWRKDFGTKAAYKMLVKLMAGLRSTRGGITVGRIIENQYFPSFR